ncbi:MAG: flavin reductase family protein [Woeseiaceae bacterium]|nr:flavin reductase family protein [Woeseiaceae bacterium]
MNYQAGDVKPVGGVPLLPGTIAGFECRTHTIQGCRGPFVNIGQVEQLKYKDRDPLLFFNGDYRNIST